MQEKLFFWLKVLALIGIGLALFLLWEQFFHPSFQPCNINETINCDAVIKGVVSKTLGIPTPLIGLAGYISILIFALKKNAKMVLGMATFGLAFCLYLAFRELVQLRVICPICVACQIDMICVFVLGVILVRKK